MIQIIIQKSIFLIIQIILLKNNRIANLFKLLDVDHILYLYNKTLGYVAARFNQSQPRTERGNWKKITFIRRRSIGWIKGFALLKFINKFRSLIMLILIIGILRTSYTQIKNVHSSLDDAQYL